MHRVFYEQVCFASINIMCIFGKKHIMNEDLICDVALSLIPCVNFKLRKYLLDKCGSSKAIFTSEGLDMITDLKDEVRSAILNGNAKSKAKELIERELGFGVSIINYSSDKYPNLLRYSHDFPMYLFMKGDCDLNCNKPISFVGTRRATYYGKGRVENIIKDLSSSYSDLVIFSGLAYGIDICSHRAALKNNVRTVAVLAHGLGSIYPSAHRGDAEEIVNNGGALISEYTFKTESLPFRFVQRNRIIAGCSSICVVGESAMSGGSLITAKLANGDGRSVGAIPGRVTDKFSAGCNMLIRENLAALVESADDVAALEGWEKDKGLEKNVSNQEKSLFPSLSISQSKIVELMKSGEKYRLSDFALGGKFSLDFSVSKVMSDFVVLAVDGIVCALPGGYYVLKE